MSLDELTSTDHGTRVIGPWRGDAPLKVHQDVSVDVLRLSRGAHLDLSPQGLRLRYLHLTQGELQVGNATLGAGSAIAVNASGGLVLEALTDVEAMLFDLPSGRIAITDSEPSATSLT